MKKNYGITSGALSVLFLLMTLNLIPVPSLSAEGFRSISSVKLTPSTYDAPWWELEETLLGTINSRLTLLGRINWDKKGNSGSQLQLTAAPVVIFGPGLYGEMGYTLGVDDHRALSHQLALDMNRETAYYFVNGGIKAYLAPGGSTHEDSFITGSAGFQKFLDNRTNPRIKYFGTINGARLWSHAVWADFLIPLGESWGISPGGTVEYTQKSWGWQLAGSVIVGVPVTWSNTLRFRYQVEVLLKPYGWGVSNLLVTDWRF